VIKITTFTNPKNEIFYLKNMGKHFNNSDIENMSKRFRTQFVNCLSGFKSLNLVGTINKEGQTNLAIISSIFHLGASPALIGMIIRPASVPRHSLENIIENDFFTINHVNESIYKKAHQTSAKYPKEISEFEAVGLQEEYIRDFKAPFVKESFIKIGLKQKEIIEIKSNQTILVVGEILEIVVPENTIETDGSINIEKAGSITVSGLDRYHSTKEIARLSYAKTDAEITEI
jgi:flavin reductase (DIM6/NTAB) family NADH-FMN oxidoreductase RutF